MVETREAHAVETVALESWRGILHEEDSAPDDDMQVVESASPEGIERAATYFVDANVVVLLVWVASFHSAKFYLNA